MNSCFQSCTHHLSIPCSNIHNTWAHQFLNCTFNVSCLMLLKDTSKKKKRKKKKNNKPLATVCLRACYQTLRLASFPLMGNKWRAMSHPSPFTSLSSTIKRWLEGWRGMWCRRVCRKSPEMKGTWRSVHSFFLVTKPGLPLWGGCDLSLLPERLSANNRNNPFISQSAFAVAGMVLIYWGFWLWFSALQLQHVLNCLLHPCWETTRSWS